MLTLPSLLLLLPSCSAPLGPLDSLASFPVDWSDWAVAEPANPWLTVTAGGVLRVGYCGEHFPAGSIGHANIRAALEAVSSAEGVAVSVDWSETPHHPPLYPDFYDRYTPDGAPFDVYFDYVDTTPFDTPMGANGGVYSYSAADDEWRTGSCFPSGCEAAAAIVAAQMSAFSGHAADPSAEDRSPGLGLWSHEVGHMVGLLHQGPADDGRAVRALDRQHFHSMTVWRGMPGLATHADDVRRGRLSAYSKAYLQWRYPDPGFSGDSAPDWYVHEILLLRDGTAAGDPPPVTADTTVKFSDHNPSALFWSAEEGAFLDCDTGAAPIVVGQVSGVSDSGCGRDEVTLSWQIDGAELARRRLGAASCAAPYVQHQWIRQLSITASDITPSDCADRTPGWVADGDCFPQSASLALVADPDDDFAELHEDDNVVTVQATLHASCP